MSRTSTPPELSPDQERALAGVLDEIIPPCAERQLPGAGELGLVAHIEKAMREAPDMKPAVVQGLAALEEHTSRRGAATLDELPRDTRIEVLNEVIAAEPAFLPGLVFHAYGGYYQNGRVLAALGMPPRPPHPEGYELEDGDLSLLDPVRRRGTLYRRV